MLILAAMRCAETGECGDPSFDGAGHSHFASVSRETVADIRDVE